MKCHTLTRKHKYLRIFKQYECLAKNKNKNFKRRVVLHVYGAGKGRKALFTGHLTVLQILGDFQS